MPFLRSQTREKIKGTTPCSSYFEQMTMQTASEQILSTHSLAPGHHSLVSGHTLLHRSAPSQLVTTSMERQDMSSVSSAIINIDMSSSGGSETSGDVSGDVTRSSLQLSLNTQHEDSTILNTAMLQTSLPESPTSPTGGCRGVTPEAILETPQQSVIGDPSVLASLLQQVSLVCSGQQNLQQVYGSQDSLVTHLSLQNSASFSASDLEVSLSQALDECSASETETGLELRRKIVQELDTLVKQWLRSTGLMQGIKWSQLEQAGGKVVTYGSFKLGVVERDSDLDLLTVVPRHVSRDFFFQDFYLLLAKQLEVTELRALSRAFVPVIKFKYKDVDVDLTLARLMCSDGVPEEEDFLTLSSATKDLEPRCLRSLNGYRGTRELLQLVPDVARFRTVLRLVKLWARANGIYGNMLGFLGGAAWAILVARACQLEGDRKGPIVNLVYLFFKVGAQPSVAWNPHTNYWDRDHAMPIITSTVPQMNSAVNVDEVNRDVIQTKLGEARNIIKAVLEGRSSWQQLLAKRPFFQEFDFYIEICARAKRDVCLWFGSVESKMRHLCLLIRKCPKVDQLHIWPEPFSKPKKAGFSSQSWYMGVKFQQGVQPLPHIFEDPLRGFTDLCLDSARQLSASNWPITYEVVWELLSRDNLPQSVTEGQKRKPSYASVTQGSSVASDHTTVSRHNTAQHSNAAGGDMPGVVPPPTQVTTTAPDLPSMATPAPILASLYHHTASLTSLAPVLRPALYSVSGSADPLPRYYTGLPSPREDLVAQFQQHGLHQSPASSTAYSGGRQFSRDPRQSPHPTVSTPHLSVENFTAYPPVTSLPPPPQYSPIPQFTSPPPSVLGLTPSQSHCRQCNLALCQCSKANTRPECSCSSYKDTQPPLQHLQLPRREQVRKDTPSDPPDRLRSVSWTSDKFPPFSLALARVSHQDQLPPSVSPSYRDISGVVPLPALVDTSVPPPPRPPPSQTQATSPRPDTPPLTFDEARMNASRKNRSRSPRTSVSELSDWSTPRPVRNGHQGSQPIRFSFANDSVFK